MESGSATSLYVNPALGLTIALGKQMEQIRQAQLNMVKQYNNIVSVALSSPFMELAITLKKTQANIVKRFLYSINTLIVQHTPTEFIQEAEIVGENTGIFNMAITFEGIFFYNNKPIDTINTGSKHGKFLKMLLNYDNNYVSDEQFLSKIGVSDELKGIGYVRRDLKKYLRRIGINVEIRRVRNQGHRLLSIRKIAN